MENFIEDCIRTESSSFNTLISEDGKEFNKERLIHASMGMQTESAEFTDALKKSLFYGKELDVVNLKEELGDMLWYISIAMDEIGTDFESEMDRVILKLKTRYPNKFSNSNALHRNLESEREVLEEK